MIERFENFQKSPKNHKTWRYFQQNPTQIRPKNFCVAKAGIYSRLMHIKPLPVKGYSGFHGQNSQMTIGQHQLSIPGNIFGKMVIIDFWGVCQYLLYAPHPQIKRGSIRNGTEPLQNCYFFLVTFFAAGFLAATFLAATFFTVFAGIRSPALPRLDLKISREKTHST